ncbi:hypothetical protein [Spirillospora sp. NPDC047279]|uniref:hypothetical protein n=1 Tax=Spirillospora sp. NPDC047279 TaxID=3155478 RepID=UPI0033CC62B3
MIASLTGGAWQSAVSPVTLAAGGAIGIQSATFDERTAAAFQSCPEELKNRC